MPVPKALLISTTCQRLCLGTFLFSFLASTFMGVTLPMNIISMAALIFLGLGGIASAFHLGRPKRFFNAFANMNSHLTQEALITPFLGIGLFLCGLNGFFINLGGAAGLVYWITVILSLLFLVSTGAVYNLSSRPAWNTPLVSVIFMLTAAEAGTITTIAIILSQGQTIPTGLVVLTFLSIAVCLICQFSYTGRLKSVGYGVNVFVNLDPFKQLYSLWLIFGLAALCVSCIGAVFMGSAFAAYVGVICAVLGIVYWTTLLFNVALKVKMFPMYAVDLNRNM